MATGGMTSKSIRIAEERFHNGAELIVNHHKGLFGGLRKVLNAELRLQETMRTKAKKSVCGFTADSLNEELRRLLGIEYRGELSTETFVEQGVFYDSPNQKKGFDFAFYDKRNNLINFRNLCLGSIRYADGAQRWRNHLARSPGAAKLFKAIGGQEVPEGQDMPPMPLASPIILGEIQFGNWALLFYDYFKALDALCRPGLDLYVYICATGKLEKSLSDGIVAYEDAVQETLAFSQVLRFPIWIIGIDFA